MNSIYTAHDTRALSRREQEVLLLVAHEYTNHEIADTLYISFHTVISHRKTALDKLGAKNTAGMIRRAFELNYLPVSSSK